MTSFNDFFKIGKHLKKHDETLQDKSIALYKQYNAYFMNCCDNYDKDPNIHVVLYYYDPYFHDLGKMGDREVYAPEIFDWDLLVLYRTQNGTMLEIWGTKIFRDKQLVGELKKDPTKSLYDNVMANDLEQYGK